ncbi:MAG: thioredoxin family protein [Candidatus Hydrothermarchaeales archaeon]
MKKRYPLVAMFILMIVSLGCISDSTSKISSKDANATYDKIIYDYSPERFDTALRSGKPTILDFSADWCIYCYQMIPILEELKAKYGGKVNFITVNADIEKELVHKYGVRTLPTYILIDEGGEAIGKKIGYTPKEKFETAIDRLLER